MDMMTEDLMSLKEIMSAQNKLGLFERILLSAKMVKTVLLRNMELNKDYMDHTLMIDDLQKQILQLQFENESIRERLGIMENMTGTDSYLISMNFSSIAENIPELARNKKMSNKLIQIKDTMNSTAYTTNINGLSSTKYPNGSRKNSKDIMLKEHAYSFGARCSTSPKLNQRNGDAEPERWVIAGHDLANMNLSCYPKPPTWQLEPIKNAKIKQFGNRREAKINEPHKMRNFETLKSSLMNYEQMDSPSNIKSNKRPTTRNLASIRNKNLRLDPPGN